MRAFGVLWAFSVTLLGGGLDAVDVPLNRYYPQEAVLVTVAERALLQSRLDQYGVIRLAPGDYLAGNTLTKLVMRSGNRVYGLGNDMIPIEFEPGTTGAVLSSVHATISFPASATVTRQNLLRRCSYSTIQINNGAVEDNLFLESSYCRLTVDHTASGYWSGNRFVRLLNHGSTPMMTLKGSVTSQPLSHGNTFVFLNSLGAYSEISNLANQRDLNVVFIDCESYSNAGANAMTVRSVDDLSIFGTSGSIRTGRNIDQGATSFWVHGHEMGTYVAPNLVQQAANVTSIVSNFNPDMGTPSNSGPNTQRFRLFNNTNSASKVLLVNEATLSTPLTSAQENAFMRALSTARTDPVWERPSFNPIPDPGGSSWNVGLGSKPSSRAAIQAEIDSQGMVFLAAGTYYLDGPLVLGPGKGLIGAGAETTVLIAMSANNDVIVGDSTNTSTNLFLADVTLQGGRSGIHHTVGGAQFTGMTISHVTIRDMADSGIWLEGLYGWDNNFIDFLNITRCPSGFKQRAPGGPANDSTPNLTYIDKNVFYQCQFVACGKALDLMGNRASNGNTWVNCLFKDNSMCAAQMLSHNSAIFANCDFINNNGHPVINVQGQLYLTGCNFSDTGSGATDFVDGIAISMEGCTFSRSGSSSVVMTAANPTWIDLINPANLVSYRNHNSYYINSDCTNVPLNLLFSGMVVNSFFPDRADLSVHAALITDQGNTVTTLVPGAVSSGSMHTQLLVGGTFSRALVSEVPDFAPVITSTGTVSAIVSAPLAYRITASNGPTGFQATGLPAWLTLNSGSGLITGTPPAVGSSTFTVTATNFVGASPAQTVNINVITPPPGSPLVTSAATASGTVGRAFSYQITATNSPTSFAIDSSAPLPPGLSLDGVTGVISGVPTAVGVTSVLMLVTNSVSTISGSLVITIQAAPVPPSGSSSGGGGGGGGCGFGIAAAAFLLIAASLLLQRRGGS